MTSYFGHSFFKKNFLTKLIVNEKVVENNYKKDTFRAEKHLEVIKETGFKFVSWKEGLMTLYPPQPTMSK